MELTHEVTRVQLNAQQLINDVLYTLSELKDFGDFAKGYRTDGDSLFELANNEEKWIVSEWGDAITMNSYRDNIRFAAMLFDASERIDSMQSRMEEAYWPEREPDELDGFLNDLKI